MNTKTLRSWTEMVKLHADVESKALTEATFAIDLGGIAANDPNVPVVNRDPEAFFRATYVTSDLQRLLEEVLASLAGKPGYNRVLKLRTPFGGGKSHTLATLLHAARSRKALDHIPEAKGLADPGEVAVAVFDGEKFDARDGKTVGQAASLSSASPLLSGHSSGWQPELQQKIQTMWGWIAWQIDPEKAFPLVAGHDRDRVAPGGDVVKELLTKGAGGRPVLILLDEVLKYMERAAAVAVLDSTLQRQAKDFFQNLTVEVAGSTNAALVYALTWSAREALGNVGLLAEIDKLAGRVDQLREPVSGDEILPVLQRRLLAAKPDESAVVEVAETFATAVTGMWRAHAETPADKQEADERGVLLRDRLRLSYPFHSALIDLMRGRWSAVDDFQRTRGALRFLATCLHALKQHGGAQSVLGPGEIP
jgi:predicted AAA+ superfamily ATPase